MHGPINVKSPNNISEWQMGFNSMFKGLNAKVRTITPGTPCMCVSLYLQIKKIFKRNSWKHMKCFWRQWHITRRNWIYDSGSKKADWSFCTSWTFRHQKATCVLSSWVTLTVNGDVSITFKCPLNERDSQGGVVSTETMLCAGLPGVRIQVRARDISLLQKHPDWLWGPPGLLFYWYWGSFWGGGCWCRWVGLYLYNFAPPVCARGMKRENFILWLLLSGVHPARSDVRIV
jgi:hypothetical protein